MNFFTNLSIEEPNQIIPSYINFNNNILFVSDKIINGIYNKEKSKSFKYIDDPPEESYDDISAEIKSTFICQENFSFKNLYNTQNYILTFYLGNSLIKNITYISSIGLGNNNKLNSFLLELKKKKLITSNIFIFNFDKFKNIGEIIIGNYPHEYNNEKYKIENFKIIGKEIISKNKWFIGFENISIINQQNKSILYNKEDIINYYIQFDNNYIILLFVISENIKHFIINYYKDECELYNLNDKRYIFICSNNIDISKFPTIILSLKNIHFQINYLDYFYKINNKYILLLQFNKYVTNIGYLGIPFLSKYNLIFNKDENFIGYYTEIHKKELSISLIVSIISVIVNIIFIIFFIRRYYKRKSIKNIYYYEINERKEKIDI